MRPALIPHPYTSWIANILARLEDGKPLSEEQLSFLLSHEKILSNYALDLVIKYYLTAHQNDPDKHLTFTIPKEKITHLNAHMLRDAVENSLKHNLTHVDLKMSVDQFLQFKSVGFHELIFWHGPQFLSRTSAFSNAIPLVLYFQWNKLFGVVKLNSLVDNFNLDGNVLIYLEDMNLRSLNQCVLDYTKTNKLNPNLILNNQMNLIKQETPEHRQYSSPRPSFHEITRKENES